MPQIERGKNGFPILLAEPDRKKTPIGNESRADLITPDHTSGPAEWGRYHDAVREASRTFDNPQEGDIKHFLNARAKHPHKVDAPAFHEAVKRQRMADLVDILDHHMRREGSLPRGSRMVRVQAPKGYLKRSLRNSSSEDIAHLRHRLTSIGHSDEHVNNYLSARVSPDMWDQASSLEVKFSEEEFDGLNFDSGDLDAEWDDPLGDVVELVKKVYESVPPPVINVYVTPEIKTES